MTAEIAILNRSAVALATDSAVTIGSGANAKTYLSENKLFELSETKPVGLMVYNSLEFYGYPWEVLIKDFRKEMGASSHSKVCDWSQCFLDWLHANHMPTPEQQEHYLAQRVRDLLQRPNSKFHRWIITLVNEGRTPERILEELQTIMNDEVRRLINVDSISKFNKIKAASNKHPPPLDETTLASWLQEKRTVIREAARSVFRQYELNDEEFKLIEHFIFEALSKQTIGDESTGLVFAGFGNDEKFPSLHHITIDGVFSDHLRCIEAEYYDVDRQASQGTIFAFGQPDVANRFLYGIDEELEDKIVLHFAEAVRGLVGTISTRFGFDNKKHEALQDLLEDAAYKLEENYSSSSGVLLREQFFTSIADMVRMMPKQEMANFAESLVNITIIKRRASAEIETVGGPIDVAVISRHEGFVWVKRKHYFDPQYNARFFWRKFGGASLSNPAGNGAKPEATNDEPG
jgi:hypothetical protein